MILPKPLPTSKKPNSLRQLFLVICLFVNGVLHAQTGIIKGNIVDENNERIPSVNIILKSDRTIGFRCAMTRTGSPGGNEMKGGNSFGKKGMKKTKRKYK